eukprot:TRINITY_DN30531_c0_g1_i1.p2 TRINITY_DN30531_c0_g1~~TRINITY_DN30531_c0_g1_i1.p2  ORF type:complete len:341 (+),score=82.80 TRINITY_DN30531_c0_g1_i1:27-1049(+)
MALDSGPSVASSVATVEQAKKTQRMLQVLKTKAEQQIQLEQQYQQHMQLLQDREQRQKEHRENREKNWKEGAAYNSARHQEAHERIERMNKFTRDCREQQVQQGTEHRLRASESVERKRRQQADEKRFQNLRRAEMHSQRHEEIVQQRREWHEQQVQRNEQRHERARGITSAYAREQEEVRRQASKADEFRINLLQKVGEGRIRSEEILKEIEQRRIEVEQESSVYLSSIGGSSPGSGEGESFAPRFRPPTRGSGGTGAGSPGSPMFRAVEGPEDQTLEQDATPQHFGTRAGLTGSSPRSLADSGGEVSRRRKENISAEVSVYDHLMAVFAQKAQLPRMV